MERAPAPCEAGILSLFIDMPRQEQTFQLQDQQQELIFLEGGAPQSWLGRSERLAASSVAMCEYHLLPSFGISDRTWEQGTLWEGYRKVATDNTLVHDEPPQS